MFINPTIETLRASTPGEEFDMPEHSTQVKLEEFLMRNRPTPFRAFPSPSEDPPEEEDFQTAVEPTESDLAEFVDLPGNGFMSMSVFPNSEFGDKEKLVESSVSRDTLRSVAENFAFANNEPQGMLMNFLLKKKFFVRGLYCTTTIIGHHIEGKKKINKYRWRRLIDQS